MHFKKGNHIELARRILNYLNENPNAKDTLEGIADWWLLQHRINEVVAQVSQAIELLVKKGFLLEKSTNQHNSIKTIYEINAKKLAKINDFLKS